MRCLFENRVEAAHELARHLTFLKGEEPVVLGLANAGVPIAEIVAQALDAPLDVMLLERLTAPKNPDHVVGAVDEHGRISMIKSTARWHHLTSQQMVAPARAAFRQLQRRSGRIRELLPEMEVRGRTVVLCSQGVVSGAKMLGGISSVRDRGARKVIVAAPAGAGESAWQMHDAADLVVVPHRPTKFTNVQDLYKTYAPVTDDIVVAIVKRWVQSRPEQQSGVKTLSMKLTNDKGQLLMAEIDLPPSAHRGSGPYPAVIFAHGYESDGRNPRTLPISRRLAKRNMISVRVDFTGHGRSEGELEDATPQRMAKDLELLVAQVKHLHEVRSECMAMVGSASGALLALQYVARDPAVRTVVVRGPMQGGEIETAVQIKAPTLLIYAEREMELGEQKREHGAKLPSTHHILEIPDATRLFNDAISREMMVNASVDWIVDHLPIGGCAPTGAADAMNSAADPESSPAEA